MGDARPAGQRSSRRASLRGARGRPWFRRASTRGRVLASSIATREPIEQLNHRRRGFWLEALVATLIFAIGSALVMWPVATDPTDRVYGQASDPLSEVWRLAQFRHGEIGLIRDTTSHAANVPSGVPLRRSVEVSQFGYDLLAWALARTFEPVLAYNLLIFLGLVTTGLATYGTVRALGAGPLGAATAGALLLLAPAHLLEAELHAPLTYVAPLPVLFLLGVRVLDRPSLRRGLSFGAGVAACGYVAAYLFLEAVTLACGIATAAVVLAARSPERRRPLAVAGSAAVLAALVVLAPLFAVLAAFKGEIETAVARSVSDVTSYSLNLGAYVSRDSDTYVGLVAAALAGLALLLPSVPPLVRLAASFVALAGLVMSLRPDTSLATLDLPMPSEVMNAIVPYWRVYGRLAVVVSVGVAVLAGFAVDRVARGGRPVAFMAAGALAVIAISDVVRRSPEPAADLDRPDPVVSALQRGSGPVAEYPLFGFDNASIGPYLFRQLGHGRPLLNGSVAGTISADLSAAAGDLGGKQARAALKLAGVREIVTNPGTSSSPGFGFALVGRFGERSVYRVRPGTADVALATVRGAYPAEPGPDGSNFAWLGAHPRLTVVSSRPGPIEVTFDAISHAVTRWVRIGAHQARVGGRPTRLRVCLRAGPDGVVSVPIEASPAAAPLPGGDVRVASIGIYHLAARPFCPNRRRAG